ncbi:MAG: DUF3455 domain-containing protein [Acidobacteria bacterium]|nr:DUF3455 domain-containing protein [Acidobacteriota bacterium]MCW5966891.1 DUF3455 domain-containing protein [Blastocatellales bacterium]
MKYKGSIRIFTLGVVVAALLAAAGAVSIPAAPAPDRSPELPSPVCDLVQVPPGHKVSFRTYAIGVQIYRWNGAGWDFVAPEAMLFAAPNYRGKVGTHYAGPTWESNSGSNVVASRVAGCTPDATAIPWLLLQTVSSDGPGIFSNVTYIQRVNTSGGLAPTVPGAFVGAEARVPYTTEYYFYRSEF